MGSHLEELEEVNDEVFARRAMARQRQITIGKSRPEYKLYINSVPYHRRDEHMPQTPDPHARISKRAFDRELACWRRGLHVTSAQLEGSNGASPKAKERTGAGGDRGQAYEDDSPIKYWSPSGTESTRAESEASSPTRSYCPTPGTSGAGNGSRHWNVKLNLFDHLSAPLPPQAVLPTPQGGNAQPMQQMVAQASAPGTWEMYQPPPTTGMVAMMPATGPAPSTPMIQFATVDQQQCGYAMTYTWSPEPVSQQWTTQGQQPAPQMQPVVALGQQMAPQVQPVDSNVVAADDQMQQGNFWQPTGPARPSPGTPRSSTNHIEETPSTPLNRVVRSAASPAMTSPWMNRTPSPSPNHGPYGSSSNHYNALQQQTPAAPAETDPWLGAALMVITQNYNAESDGYLTVAMGSRVKAIMDQPQLCSDSKCEWHTYVFCSDGNGLTGWVPQQILWRCFCDNNGRDWAFDDTTGRWCWVDELGQTSTAQ